MPGEVEPPGGHPARGAHDGTGQVVGGQDAHRGTKDNADRQVRLSFLG
ncbi:hypothetical protein [Streptomyces sp. NPDC088766]